MNQVVAQIKNKRCDLKVGRESQDEVCDDSWSGEERVEIPVDQLCGSMTAHQNDRQHTCHLGGSEFEIRANQQPFLFYLRLI